MKSLILVGGYGTRLRPLTLTRPKPLVDFCNKPILIHQMEALVEAGVDTIVLATSYQCDILEDKLQEFSKKVEILIMKHNIHVIFSKEDVPLGTGSDKILLGGPLALAREHLDGNEPFFVLNSDVICQYPFSEMLKYHLSKMAEATIAVTPVDDPTKYGVVVYDDNGLAQRFVEKPSTFVSNKINAGIYVLNSSVLSRIKVKINDNKLRVTSIEKEIFPSIALDKSLFAYELQGFWMDIGQPPDYLLGSQLFLKNLAQKNPNVLGTQPDGFHQSCLIHSTATIGNDCSIENSVIGENVTIGDGVCLRNSVILSDAIINSHTFIDESIIGWKCNIGCWVRIQAKTVLGENVHVADEVFITESKILPHKNITNSITSQIIM